MGRTGRQEHDSGNARGLERYAKGIWCKQLLPIRSACYLDEQRVEMGKRKIMDELFEGRHFDHEVIILCVRWYLLYKLSLRDLVEMMAERGLSLAHTTICVGYSAMPPEFVKR
jgi:hypothetical protein